MALGRITCWELFKLAGERHPLPYGTAEKIAAILREAEARPNKK